MDIRIEQLESREQALALTRLVYEAHGLTHHRSWLYEVDTILSYNRAGYVRSFLAMDGDRCVGHLAAIRPYFEFNGRGASDAATSYREVGLRIVHPAVRGQGIRARLTSVLYGWCMERGYAGLVSRCTTSQTDGQRLERAMGGVPVSMLLASVPQATGGKVAGQSLSTLAVYVPLRHVDAAPVYLPPADAGMFLEIFNALGEQREQLPVPGRAGVGPRSELRVKFDPARQTGHIHVLRAGPDLQERVLERFEWMLGGHIRHVTVHAPLSSPHTARAVEAWKGHGMLFGGLLPGMDGGEVAVYQGVRDAAVRAEDIKVLDPFAARLKQRVLDDYWGAQDLRRLPRLVEEAS